MIAIIEADGAASKDIYDSIPSNRGRYFGVSFDRLLGLLAGTMGHLDDAHAHYEDALAFCLNKAGYLVELA